MKSQTRALDSSQGFALKLNILENNSHVRFFKKGISLHVLNLSGPFNPSMFTYFIVSSVIKSHEPSGLGGDKAILVLTVHSCFL